MGENAKLVSLTVPAQNLQERGVKTAEDLIVYCARVSNPTNQTNVYSGDKLLRYLVKHQHWSPFEMATMTVEIKTSRAIASQILRHRSFSFQEFSQRYSTASKITDVEVRRQADKNRQSSTEVFNPDVVLDPDGNDIVTAEWAIRQHAEQSLNLYDSLIDAGVARESARMVLPLATETTIYMTGSVRSWIHYLQLRTSEDTQKEHREIAEQILDILKEEMPTIYHAVFDSE